MKKIFALMACCFLWMGCQSTQKSQPPPPPTIAPSPLELRNSYYSLRQSNFIGYHCNIKNEFLSKMSDQEFAETYAAMFHREPQLVEKSFLKKLHWSVVNTDAKQNVTPSPSLKEFPTTESKDLAEKFTSALIVMNKVLTLTYLETFADRPDLSLVNIGTQDFQVINAENQEIATIDFNMKSYRIYYGLGHDTMDITVKKVGSFGVPELIDLNYGEQNTRFRPEFQSEGGFPRLKNVFVSFQHNQNLSVDFPFENCSYLKAEARN